MCACNCSRTREEQTSEQPASEQLLPVGEEEQQETPAAAWSCTVFLNILCILCTVFLNVEEFFLNTPSTVFLNVEEHAQLSEAQRACNGQGHELSKDTRGALHSRQTAANGMGETGLEMDTRAKMSGVGAVRINVLAVLCRRLGLMVGAN